MPPAKRDYVFVCRPFDANPPRQLLLTVNHVWFKLDLLDGFAKEAASILSNGNISGWRLNYLEEDIEQRIQSLHTIWD